MWASPRRAHGAAQPPIRRSARVGGWLPQRGVWRTLCFQMWPARALTCGLAMCVALLPAAPPQHLHDVTDALGHRETLAHRHSGLHLGSADHDHGADQSVHHDTHAAADHDGSTHHAHGLDTDDLHPYALDSDGPDLVAHEVDEDGSGHESDAPGHDRDASRNLTHLAVLATGSGPSGADARVEPTPAVVLTEPANAGAAWRWIARPVFVERARHGPPRAPHPSRPPPTAVVL